jgi:hypothetical protein
MLPGSATTTPRTRTVETEPRWILERRLGLATDEGLEEPVLRFSRPTQSERPWWECHWAIDDLVSGVALGIDGPAALQIAMKRAATFIARFRSAQGDTLRLRHDECSVISNDVGAWFRPIDESGDSLQPLDARAHDPPEADRGALSFQPAIHATTEDLVTFAARQSVRDRLGQLQLISLGGIDDHLWAALAEAPHLTRLTVCECRELRGVGLGQLGSLRRLTWRNAVDPRVFEELREVPELVDVLLETDVDDDALTHIAAWKALTHLDLWRQRITDAGLRALSERSTLRFLSLSTRGVTLDGLLAVLRTPTLETLWVHHRGSPDVIDACRRARPDVRISWLGHE